MRNFKFNSKQMENAHARNLIMKAGTESGVIQRYRLDDVMADQDCCDFKGCKNVAVGKCNWNHICWAGCLRVYCIDHCDKSFSPTDTDVVFSC